VNHFARVCQTRVNVIAREVVVLLQDLIGSVASCQEIHHELNADPRAFDDGLANEHVRIGHDSISPFHGFSPNLLLNIMRATAMDFSLVNHSALPEAKIALFRSLFRGREDIYPRRFENRRTGKTGYAPACAHEWVRGICEKPRVKCTDCLHQRFLPVTDDVIRWHLSGRDDGGRPFVAGVYPLLRDETCFFVAVDFDKGGWQEDATAFLDTCHRLEIPAALERSRSGRGAHVWLFFDEAIPAALGRRLASHILTETMERRPDVGLDSYDRLFPNQDTLPHGGFGNLIALPLQKGPRGQGHSLFLDDHLEPWSDQWAFLASIRKITRAHAESLVQNADRRGRILGVRLPPLDEESEEPWSVPPSRHRREPPIAGDLPEKD